ncbi:MAG: hypothetical protein ABIO38_04550 [Luteimonas sp.]
MRDSGHTDFQVARLKGAGHSSTASTTGNNADIVKERHMVAGYWDVVERWLRKRGFAK